MLWLSLIVLLCLMTLNDAQVLQLSTAVDFSTLPFTMTFPPQLDENSSCSVGAILYPYQKINFGHTFDDFYEVIVESSGPQPFYVGIYPNGFDPTTSCEGFNLQGRNFRSFGRYAPTVDAFNYIDSSTSLVIFMEPPANVSLWNQTVIVNIYTTFSWDWTDDLYMNATTLNYSLPHICHETSELVPCATFTWQQTYTGLFDIYAALDDLSGFSLGLYSGNAGKVLSSPCSWFLAGDNTLETGPAIYGVALQQGAVYTLIASGYNDSLAYYVVLQVANSNFLTGLQPGFTLPDYSNSSTCEPSANFTNTYWLSFNVDDSHYSTNIVYGLLVATDGWNIYAYSGENIGVNSSIPPYTCTPIASSLYGGDSLFLTVRPSETYTFVISSTENAANVSFPYPFLYFMIGAVPLPTTTTSTTGRPQQQTKLQQETRHLALSPLQQAAPLLLLVLQGPPPPLQHITSLQPQQPQTTQSHSRSSSLSRGSFG